jgi:hypothetical protein
MTSSSWVFAKDFEFAAAIASLVRIAMGLIARSGIHYKLSTGGIIPRSVVVIRTGDFIDK